MYHHNVPTLVSLHVKMVKDARLYFFGTKNNPHYFSDDDSHDRNKFFKSEVLTVLKDCSAEILYSNFITFKILSTT